MVPTEESAAPKGGTMFSILLFSKSRAGYAVLIPSLGLLCAGRDGPLVMGETN
jgi:hypothetical protein